MKKTKKAQALKPRTYGNRDLAVAMQELRSSSASTPHRNKARYNKKSERQGSQRGEW